MAELAKDLLRTVARAFYGTEHILVIDALIIHSTLSDHDLAHVLGMQSKPLRKLCGRLKEDGLLSVQSRAERKADGSGGYYGGTPQAGRERVTHRDWYYLNYHRAIDSIKYRMHRLNKHIESLGMPTTEKKDLSCPRCKSQYTELEAMDRIDLQTGLFLCHRCGHHLDPMEEDERANENESMKRLNSQLEKLLQLMQKIDAAEVPENDFDTALSKQKPVSRADTHPASRIEVVDLPNRNLQSTKGLDIKPEKVAVQVQDGADLERNDTAEAIAKRERQLRQNALPEWITKSTITGDITTAGAKEEYAKKEREAHTTTIKKSDGDDKKPSSKGDDEVMEEYWRELAQAQEREAAEARKEDGDEDDDDDDDDDFEDVDVTGGGNTPAMSGARNGVAAPSTGMNTPLNAESSNATDDERDPKRVRIEGSLSSLRNGDSKANGGAADTPAASDEDDDDLEFENV